MPLVALPDGTLEYRDLQGQLHRPTAEGPAVLRPNGSEEYWEKGGRVSPEDAEDLLLKIKTSYPTRFEREVC